MGSTSPEALARQILASCLAGEQPSTQFRELVEAACGSAGASRVLFGILAEGLSDRFEPRLVDAYARLFAEAIAFALPQYRAADLVARYQRVRRLRRFEGDAKRVRNVFVLSRVTLGADIAVTSLALDAARCRFPGAQTYFVGSEKKWRLFVGDPRIRWAPVTYGGTLRDRLAAGLELGARLSKPNSVVIDPDSRLTQLGLLPVCPEENYFFFESRSYGGDGDDSLAELTHRWLAETFDVEDARPWLAPAAEGEGADVAVSFGVGDNPAKRIPDPFEEELLGSLAGRGLDVLVDKGAGGEEAARVERAASGVSRIRMFEGSFAAFAARIMRSRLYIGYDSAGQHAAAAAGVPLVTVFAGFPSPRFFARWRPIGPGPKVVIRVGDPDPAAVLQQTLQAVTKLGE